MKNKKPKAQDLPGIKGKGVAPEKIPALDEQIENLIDFRDDAATAKEGIKTAESALIASMEQHKLLEYQHEDMKLFMDKGKTKVKLKKVDSAPGEDSTED